MSEYEKELAQGHTLYMVGRLWSQWIFFFQFELTSYLAMYTVRTIAYDVSCFLQIFYKTTLWDLKHNISTSSLISVGLSSCSSNNNNSY